MKEIKKYMDIVRLGHKTTEGVIKEGDYITITEKIDGANSSFTVDGDNIACYSRNTPLDEHNTLRGFYNWIQTTMLPIKEKLNSNYRYFGEWLVSHSIPYRQECYNKFYLFSIYDDEKQEYLSDDIVKSEAEKLGLNTSPYFYEGKYQSFEHLMSFVGKTELALEHGEGIVVKNVNYKDSYGKQIFVKLVHPKFAEVQKQKLPKNPNIAQFESEFVGKYLTVARVEKLLNKLVDEGVLVEDYGIEDMGIILKNLGNRVYDDLIKEEGNELGEQFEEKDVRRSIGKKLPVYVKEILQANGRM